jgi:hypothetical protein
LKVDRRFGRIYRLNLQDGFLFGLFFGTKMEATRSSELSIDFQRGEWCYSPEGSILNGDLFGDFYNKPFHFKHFSLSVRIGIFKAIKSLSKSIA